MFRSCAWRRGLWLVVDMDGTITPTPSKAGGHHLPLSQSPCLELLQQWLQLGGSLCVVSTAGRRMWKQVFEALHVTERDAATGGHARGTIVLSPFSGAALFHQDANNGNLVEDVEFRDSVVPGGTCIPTATVANVEQLLYDRMKVFFRDLTAEPALLNKLSRKYVGPFGALLDQLRDIGEERFFAGVLTPDALRERGRFLKETKNSLLTVMAVPGAPVPASAVAQVSLSGIPQAHFNQVFGAVEHDRIASWGLELHAQPNSVVVRRPVVDKHLPLQWMTHRSQRYGNFSREKAIAIADAPESVDRALLTFGIPFVSCSPRPPSSHGDVLLPHPALWVGREEHGTADFLRWLVQPDHHDLIRSDRWPLLADFQSPS